MQEAAHRIPQLIIKSMHVMHVDRSNASSKSSGCASTAGKLDPDIRLAARITKLQRDDRTLGY